MLRTIQTSVKLGDFVEHIFVSFQQIPLNLGIFTNCNAFFLAVLTDFAYKFVPMSKVENTLEGSIGSERHRNSRVCPGLGNFSKFSFFNVLTFKTENLTISCRILRKASQLGPCGHFSKRGFLLYKFSPVAVLTLPVG